METGVEEREDYLMKRMLTIFMALAVMLVLVSCGNKTGQSTGEGAGQSTSRETGQGTGEEADQSTSRESDQGTGDASGQSTSPENGSTQGDGSAGSPAASKEDAGGQQTETSTELRDDYEDNFDVGTEEAAEFARMIKEAVAQKDVEMLAGLTGFPVYVGLSGGIVVETKEDFVALDVEELLSDEMVSSIAEADENDLSPSMAGFTLYGSDGAPSITFGVREGSLAISGINYGY